MSQSSHERSFTSSLEPFTPHSGASGDFGTKRGRTELGAHNDLLSGPTQPTASALGQKKKKGLAEQWGQAGATPAGTSLLPDLLHAGNNMEAHATTNTTQPPTGR